MSGRDAVADVLGGFGFVEDGESPHPIYIPEASAAAETPVAGMGASQRYRLIGALLVLLDVLCLTGALLAAHSLRFGFLPGGDYLVGIALAAVLWVGVFHAFGLYAPQRFSRLEELRRTVSAIGIGIVLIILLTFWFEIYLSRSWMAIASIIALVTEVSARAIVRAYVYRLRARGSLALRTVVVGSGEHGADLMEALDAKGSGSQPIAYIDARSSLIASDEISTMDRVERLRALLRGHEPDCVFVASPNIGTEPMFALMQAARQEGVIVRVYTQLSGVLASRLTAQPVGEWGMALTLKAALLTPLQRLVKRAMDLGLAAVVLIVASPVLLCVALAVKCTSRGPVLFRQERITEGGRSFPMFKFRTMLSDADRHLEEHAIDNTIPFFKLKSDPRVTRIGRFLRKWSIDELPQLFNVLLGDMSLVGPRPLPAEQVSANPELLGPRHEVRAGVTGWWQIRGRSDMESDEAIRTDLFYIENWSPALDLYILLRTAAVLFTRQGAY